MLTAPRMVRTERAVRPCLPITLPTSCGATRRLSTVFSPRLTASTATAFGSSTRARAISRTNSSTCTVSSWVMILPLNLAPVRDLVRNLIPSSGRGFCHWLCGCSHWVVGHDLFHARRELRALAAPVGDPLMLQVHAGRVSAGIVGAHNLDGAAIAGAVLLNHDNAVIRLLAGAETRQTNHNHDESVPFEFLSLSKMNRELPSRIPIRHSLCERESYLWFCATMARQTRPAAHITTTKY